MHFPVGFTGIVGANGSGKSTLLQLATGGLAPVSGSIEGVQGAIYCEQRTDTPPESLAGFLDDWDSDAFELRGRLGVEPDWLDRWDVLSHGERKRAQIAVALWQNPVVLAIDEPTNHIDSQAREMLIASLGRFRGVGLIVSHDRDLLDELCAQCLWLDPPHCQLFQGNFAQASEQKQNGRDSAAKKRKHALGEHRRLQREVVRRREKAAQEHSKRSKRGLSAKDHDAREKIDRARVADQKAGQTLRQLDGTAARSKARLDSTRVEKERETSIWLSGASSRRDNLFMLDPGKITMGSNRVLRFPQLFMKPQDRIAITGLNGSGKSTLVHHLLRLVNVPPDKLVVITQELAASVAIQILEDVRGLKNEQLGYLMNIVSRLGSRPRRLLESRQPSPGEMRKLILALGMLGEPHLIVMDEPTNHLDLPSIEALENALLDCPCGLLLVSHDQRFLDKLAVTRWSTQMDDQRNTEVVLCQA
jgi:ATPase subunit of ABC transporter with duplicated ATPase domains